MSTEPRPDRIAEALPAVARPREDARPGAGRFGRGFVARAVVDDAHGVEMAARRRNDVGIRRLALVGGDEGRSAERRFGHADAILLRALRSASSIPKEGVY